MKTDISGRRKAEPIFNISPLHLSFRVWRTQETPSKARNYVLSRHITLLENFLEVKHVLINRRDVCPVSLTSCQLYIHLHPLAKTCLHPAADRLSAVQSPVKSRWVRSAPWKHLCLISLHRTGAFRRLDFPEVHCDNSWFTRRCQSLLWKPLFPSETIQLLPRLSPTLMSTGYWQCHTFQAGCTLREDFPSSTGKCRSSYCYR